VSLVAGLAGLLMKAKISAGWARPIAWALLVAAAGLLAWLAWSQWLGARDERVVAKDRSTATIQILNRTIPTERQAGAAKDARDRAFANEQTQLKEAADDAAGNGHSPLDALFDELR